MLPILQNLHRRATECVTVVDDMKNFQLFGAGFIVNHYDDYYKSISKYKLKDLVSRVQNVKSRTFHDTYNYLLNIVGKPKEYILLIGEIFGILDEESFKSEYYTLVVEERYDISKAYEKAFNNHFDFERIKKNHIFNEYRNDIYKMALKIVKHISMKIDVMILEWRIKDLDYEYIIAVDKFNKEYFRTITQHCKGFIVKNGKDEDIETYMSNHSIPIMKSDVSYKCAAYVGMNTQKDKIFSRISKKDILEIESKMDETTILSGEQPKYQGAQFKIYAPITDLRFVDIIANSDWYQGVAPVKTEFLIAKEGTTLFHDALFDFHKQLFTKLKGKEIILSVPDFRPEKSDNVTGDMYTDHDSFVHNAALFLTAFSAASSAVFDDDTTIRIVVPMIRIHSEVIKWKYIIQTAFDTEKIKKVEVGIMIETESAFEYYEDYKDMDFVIIGLNDLIEEMSYDHNRYSRMSKADILELLWPDIRDFHQHMRSYKINVRQIVSGNCLSNPMILKKFLSSGFTEFSIPIHHIKALEETLSDYHKSRGSFIGVAAARPEKKIAYDALKDTREKQKEELKKQKEEEKKIKKQQQEKKRRDENKEKREKVIKEILAKQESKKEKK